ncbi:polyprotein [Phytophthora megakarya]|uniref:Polyprotein n=1 Tax=Phytophthora megakarya TaxID=4795 RepID=A0A225VZU7_9STRA|nr:polyprotein [Phytophthora megakarya]
MSQIPTAVGSGTTLEQANFPHPRELIRRCVVADLHDARPTSTTDSRIHETRARRCEAASINSLPFLAERRSEDGDIDIFRRPPRPTAPEQVVPLNRHHDRFEISRSRVRQDKLLLSPVPGKKKEWSLGKLVTDQNSFLSLESLQSDVRLTFEPPQDESHMRAYF